MKYVVHYKDLPDLEDRVFGADLRPWYNRALDILLANHTNERRYAEIFV